MRVASSKQLSRCEHARWRLVLAPDAVAIHTVTRWRGSHTKVVSPHHRRRVPSRTQNSPISGSSAPAPNWATNTGWPTPPSPRKIGNVNTDDL